jgi:hypothetical protein
MTVATKSLHPFYSWSAFLFCGGILNSNIKKTLVVLTENVITFEAFVAVQIKQFYRTRYDKL